MHILTFEVLFFIGFAFTIFVNGQTIYYMYKFLVDIEINFFKKEFDYIGNTT